MTRLRARYVVLLGIGLFVLGFVYGVVFVNVPYQDPPQEVYERWQRDSDISGFMMAAGAAIMLLGCAVACLRKMLGWKSRAG